MLLREYGYLEYDNPDSPISTTIDYSQYRDLYKKGDPQIFSILKANIPDFDDIVADFARSGYLEIEAYTFSWFQEYYSNLSKEALGKNFEDWTYNVKVQEYLPILKDENLKSELLNQAQVEGGLFGPDLLARSTALIAVEKSIASNSDWREAGKHLFFDSKGYFTTEVLSTRGATTETIPLSAFIYALHPSLIEKLGIQGSAQEVEQKLLATIQDAVINPKFTDSGFIKIGGEDILLLADLKILERKGLLPPLQPAYQLKEDAAWQHPIHFGYLAGLAYYLRRQNNPLGDKIMAEIESEISKRENQQPTAVMTSQPDKKIHFDHGNQNSFYLFRLTEGGYEDQGDKYVINARTGDAMGTIVHRQTSHWSINCTITSMDPKWVGDKFLVWDMEELINANRENVIGGTEGDIIFWEPVVMPKASGKILERAGLNLEQLQQQFPDIQVNKLEWGHRWLRPEAERSRLREQMIKNGLFYGTHGDHWSMWLEQELAQGTLGPLIHDYFIAISPRLSLNQLYGEHGFARWGHIPEGLLKLAEQRCNADPDRYNNSRIKALLELLKLFAPKHEKTKMDQYLDQDYFSEHRI